ncbi:hypothetical protein ACS0TY_027431 [Phlomoides rotata]
MRREWKQTRLCIELSNRLAQRQIGEKTYYISHQNIQESNKYSENYTRQVSDIPSREEQPVQEANKETFLNVVLHSLYFSNLDTLNATDFVGVEVVGSASSSRPMYVFLVIKANALGDAYCILVDLYIFCHFTVQYFKIMDDDVELHVLLVTLFGLIAQMIKENNTFVILMSYGFLKFHRQSKRRRLFDRTYSVRSKVPQQIEKLHFLVGHHDETCKDHIRMNTDCFNRLCYLLRNLGGLRDTRNVSISEQVAIFLTVLSHHTKNRVVKHSFNRSGYTISKHFNLVLNTLLKLYIVLLVTPEPVPEDSTDYRWKYFKMLNTCLLF